MDDVRAAGTEPRPPPLSVDTRRVGASVEADEPLSPTARLFQDLYVVTVVGLGMPINLETFRAGLDATLVQHPRFCSIRVMDAPESKVTPRWVGTTVNLDDHVLVPDLDPVAVAANPDEALEDYVASLSTLPMDGSRPLWEVHVLDFPTSESASAVALRFHHALGDGVSLISLFVACTRSAADPDALPAMASHPARRTAAARSSSSSGFVLAFAARVLSFVALAWHTVVDMAGFLALVLLGGDPPTVFTGVPGVEFRRKRFVSRSLSFSDVKHVKNVLRCTVNDVLVGVTSAALSRYYFRKRGDSATKKGMCLRSVLVVNMRPTPGVQKLAKMMESSKHMKWGNRLGYIILPFHIALHDDPLEYVRKAKKTVDRKKHSLEATLTHMITEAATKLFGVKVSGALFHRMIARTTMPFSNVPGPVEPVLLYGNPVMYIAPTIYGNPSALTTHWQSYGDTIRVILAVDDAQFPDPHQLLDDFDESLKLIRDATSGAL
ncbi:hypothetical protein ACP70R_048709 [Stipagrostis hirtigluma subsp. patula]